MSQQPAQSQQAAIAPHAARPIMTVGVFLVAFVVLSIIVLAPSLARGTLDLAVVDPWPVTACLVLAYCVPCIAVIVVVIMAKVHLPRAARYLLFALSIVGATIPGCIAFMACISEPDSEGAYLAFSVIRSSLWWMAPLLAVMGVAMGLSLPVAGQQKDSRAPDLSRDHPRRFRCLVLVAVLFWVSVAYQGVYSCAPYIVGPYAHGAITYFLDQSIMGPSAAFLGATLVFSLIWSFASLAMPVWLQRLLLWVPLLLFGWSLLISCVDMVTLSGSYSLSYAATRISGVFVLQMGLLGIVCGAGLSRVD